MLSCTRLPKVDTLGPGRQSVRPPVSSHLVAVQQARGSARPRPTPTRPDEARGLTRPRSPRPEEAGGFAWAQPRTPAASHYIDPPHPFAFHMQHTQGAYDVPYFPSDAFARAMALAEDPFLYDGGASPGYTEAHDFLVDEDPAPQPTPAEALSRSQLAGAPVPTQQPVLSTPSPLGSRQTRAPDRLSLSGPRP